MAVDRAHTRAEHEAAKARLADAEVTVIRPLRDMHQENHIGPLLDRLVQRAAQRPGDT